MRAPSKLAFQVLFGEAGIARGNVAVHRSTEGESVTWNFETPESVRSDGFVTAVNVIWKGSLPGNKQAVHPAADNLVLVTTLKWKTRGIGLCGLNRDLRFPPHLRWGCKCSLAPLLPVPRLPILHDRTQRNAIELNRIHDAHICRLGAWWISQRHDRTGWWSGRDTAADSHLPCRYPLCNGGRTGFGNRDLKRRLGSLRPRRIFQYPGGHVSGNGDDRRRIGRGRSSTLPTCTSYRDHFRPRAHLFSPGLVSRGFSFKTGPGP